MQNEYNDYGVTNPNGRSNGIPQYLPSRFGNETIGAVNQYPTRHVEQQSRVAQVYDWCPKDEDEDEDGDTKDREGVQTEQTTLDTSFPDSVDTFTGSESGLLSTQLAAASVGGVALAAVVYVVSLFVAVSSCSVTTDTLAFTLSIRNPDNVALQAVLTSDAGTVTRDVTDAAYLLFDGLEKGAEYAFSIVNAETGQTLYHKTYVTATENPYQVSVENAELSPDGIFSFDLSVEGLQRSDFYTVTVMDADGHAIFTVDGTNPEASFSVPTGTATESGSMPFLTVSVDGKTFMPRVWEDSVRDGGSEPESDAAAPEETQPPEILDAPEDTQVSENPDAPENLETPPELPEETQSPEPPAEVPQEQTPQPPAEVPQEQTPQPPAEVSQEQTPQPPAEVPQEQTPQPPAEVSQEQTPQLPAEVSQEQTPQPPAQVPQEQEQTPDAPEEVQTPEVPDTGRGEVKWTWREDGTATAEIPDPDNPGNVVTVEATVTESVQDADCTTDGVRTYTASVTGADGQIYTDTHMETIPAKGHSYQRVSLHTENGVSFADYICSECGESYRMSAAATEEKPNENP